MRSSSLCAGDSTGVGIPVADLCARGRTADRSATVSAGGREHIPALAAPRRHLGGGAVASVMADAGPLAAAGVLSIVLARGRRAVGKRRVRAAGDDSHLAVLLFSLGLAAGITYEVSGGRWSIRRAFRESYAAALVLGLLGFGAAIAFYAFTRDNVMRAFDPPVVVLALASIPPFLAAQFASAILLGADRDEGRGAPAHERGVHARRVVGAGRAVRPNRGDRWHGRVERRDGGGRRGSVEPLHATRRPGAGAPAAEGIPIRTPGWIGTCSSRSITVFDVIILAAYASTTEVGVYSVALTLTGLAGSYRTHSRR